jgi:hypothetical protein
MTTGGTNYLLMLVISSALLDQICKHGHGNVVKKAHRLLHGYAGHRVLETICTHMNGASMHTLHVCDITHGFSIPNLTCLRVFDNEIPTQLSLI